MNNSASISRVFSAKVVNEILKNGSSDTYDYVVQNYITDPDKKTNAAIISELYSCIGCDYRNEYYYLNTLLNKLLGGIHSINSTTALSQLRIAGHIADFVLFNTDSIVFEIKSDLDNLDRLSDQIKDYYRVFSRVAVLVPDYERIHTEKTLNNLGKMGEAVGIYNLSEKDTIFDRRRSREPKDYNEQLDHYSIFTVLRKKEYEHIISGFFGELPVEKPVYYFDKCLEEFRKIPIDEAKSLAHQELKKRNKAEKKIFDRIPMEMRAVIYFGGLTKYYYKMEPFLAQKYQGR